jgi:ADP-heptose:LPS heptosyltransferase
MRILVIRPGALGDVLLTLPTLQTLSAAFPQASIELMGNLAVVQWLPGRSVVQAVASFDRADLAALFQPEAKPAASLQEYLGSFDLILSYATAPEHVFARNLARLARARVLVLDVRPQDVPMHMSMYLQQPLADLGISPDAGYPALHLSAADQQQAARWWSEHGLQGRTAVAIHPGSGSPAKNWSADRFARVARHLQHERGAGILLVAGPADHVAVNGMSLATANLASLPLPQQLGPILLQNLPLPLMAAILSRCQLYVGNDSGVSHLAAAVGAPTVAIFGPTDPDVWAPRGPAVRIVRAAVPCAPCTPRQRQACQQRTCLQAVSVSAVLDAIAMALAARE